MTGPIPRIQARVGQASEPPEVAGKWFFEVFLSTLGGGEKMPMGTFGPWETEELAHAEMRTAVKIICDAIELQVAGRVSGKFIDMNTNEIRSWEEH